MASPQSPLLLYVLPILTVLVFGVSSFVGNVGPEVRSALVLGGPTDGEEPFRGRIQALVETHGAIEPIARQPLVLQANQGRAEVRRKLVTDDSGWVEFELPLRRDEPFELSVRDELGNSMAAGAPRLEGERWARSARRRGGRLDAKESGPLSARLEVERSILAVPFPGRVKVVVQFEGKPLAGAPLSLEGTGLELDGLGQLITNDQGNVDITVRPNQHVSSLRVSVAHEGHELEFEQTLPVIPGAYGLREEEDAFIALSPVPREDVWFTYVRDDERLEGGRVPLSEDGKGVFFARLPKISKERRPGTYLVLSSSADGRSPSTVGYPLDGQENTMDAWDAYLIDGAPVARVRAEAQRRKVRWTLGAYAALSGLLTLVLFVARVRRSDRQLAQQLEGAGAEEGAQDKSPLPLLVAVGGLFFAFSAGVLWIVAR